jgi:hypothetical protein
MKAQRLVVLVALVLATATACSNSAAKATPIATMAQPVTPLRIATSPPSLRPCSQVIADPTIKVSEYIRRSVSKLYNEASSVFIYKNRVKVLYVNSRGPTSRLCRNPDGTTSEYGEYAQPGALASYQVYVHQTRRSPAGSTYDFLIFEKMPSGIPAGWTWVVRLEGVSSGGGIWPSSPN